ncbi:hypothetical protein [Hippea alviniae]|uniref:hypothetical protein n=1 Tax=Hippea alviniae TaxID=1279027 RepID=UPI0003B48FAF|nr:hypothetical protein [Hippea alviniae]
MITKVKTEKYLGAVLLPENLAEPYGSILAKAKEFEKVWRNVVRNDDYLCYLNGVIGNYVADKVRSSYWVSIPYIDPAISNNYPCVYLSREIINKKGIDEKDFLKNLDNWFQEAVEEFLFRDKVILINDTTHRHLFIVVKAVVKRKSYYIDYSLYGVEAKRVKEKVEKNTKGVNNADICQTLAGIVSNFFDEMIVK